MFQAPLESAVPFVCMALGIGAVCLLILARDHPKVKPLLAPIFRKRTIGGWILFIASTVFLVSEKWDSINSFFDKLKKMGPFLKFIADAAQSPLVQLIVFLVGVIWIVWAATSSSKTSENKNNNGLVQPTTEAPRLKIACGPDIEGCVKETLFTAERLPTNFFRVKAEAQGIITIKNCTGFLTRIEKDGKTKWGGDSAQLTFAQGEDPDTFAKSIITDVPQFLDVLAVTSKGEIIPGTYRSTAGRFWPYKTTIPEIFSELGDYVLTVVIIGDGVPPVTAPLNFTWTGERQTSLLALIPSKSIMPPKTPVYLPPKFTGVEMVQPDHSEREQCLDCASSLLKNKVDNSFHAICRCDIHKLKTNEDVEWVCDELAKHQHEHPFSLIEAYVPRPDWLKFILWARRMPFQSLERGSTYLQAAEDWRIEKGYSEPPGDVRAILVMRKTLLNRAQS